MLRRITLIAAACVTFALVGACKSSSSKSGAPSSNASASAVGSTTAELYRGPVGAVEGIVTIKGDEPPDDETLKVNSDCTPAAETYRKLFRKGPHGEVSDAMVAVTGYRGVVAASTPAIAVSINKCAFDKRTYTLSLGQDIEVYNRDDRLNYIPYLYGDTAPAHMVAVRGTAPIKLHPKKIGRYMLVDEMNRPWMRADVIVLKYPTHAVTSSDGRFRIEGIPAGPATISAFLPIVDATVEQPVEIEGGKTVQIQLSMTYDQTKVPSAAQAGASDGGREAGSGGPAVIR